ncbi:DNA internalization-related competence protein ComEC/Rec2 [Philodulcilactobacillus myokoensis]|uniref:DNA internalization-related competence protein ComEC/Rec2 n=1 Tax=Philodulcilactobacillus myokoensis TaxID=2929573 RepID=A0A9W6ETF8_9LACO|nr:DNA internalization-related competence protein ComEC/Rec2 [Philodulcilactobacillus myokoensis]
MINHKQMQVQIYPDDIQYDGDYYHGRGWSDGLNQHLIISGYAKNDDDLNQIKQTNHVSGTWLVNADVSPIKSPTNVNQFNASRFYQSQNISNQVKINQMIQFKPDHSLIAMIHNLRFKMMQSMDQLPHPLNLYGLSLILGSMNNDFNSELTGIKQLGLIHLFSISGLHVYYIVNMLELFFIYLRMKREDYRLLIMALLPVYFVIAGSSIGLLRSILMVETILTTKFLKINLNPLDVWSITLLINLFLYPQMLIQFGCQLSYALSFGLIFTNHFSFLKQTALMNLIGLPIIIYHIYQWHLLTMFANLLILPLFSILIFPMVIIGCSVGLFIPIVGQIIAQILQFFDAFVNLIGNLPGNIMFGKLNIYITLILFLITFSIIAVQRKFKILFLIMLYAVSFLSIHFPFNGEVSYFDVGQGDSFLVREPFNKTITLIDTGGKITFGNQPQTNHYQADGISINYLHSIGIDWIDNLCISHQDADHCGDLPAFLSEMKVKRLFIPLGMVNNQHFMNRIDPYINKTKIIQVKANDHINGLPFDIVHPFVQGLGNNHDSMVLNGYFGGLKWLFMGDLDQAGENDIIQKMPNLRTDVLKVGHHGSNTSSSNEFLNAVQPKIAIISAGRNNRYHHPNPETIVKIKQRHMIEYNTQTNGMITYRYFNHYGSWHPFIKNSN